MKPTFNIRLGVNIDHVATLRNARGGVQPDPVRAALVAQEAGADGITAHLREDRRHIRDEDILRLKREIKLPLNLEMAATEEMIFFAEKIKPHACCIVPEKREERTTEGGLDVTGNKKILSDAAKRLKEAGIRVSLFINPALAEVEAAKEIGADIVELHTGRYCEAAERLSPHLGPLPEGEGKEKPSPLGRGLSEGLFNELEYIRAAAAHTARIGLECHAGHGLSFDTVAEIARIPEVVELNIGHFLIGESVFMGLEGSIRHMKKLMREARG